MECIATSKKENLLELKSEINGKLKGKFLRVHLSGKYCCFKVLFIKEILSWDTEIEDITNQRKDGTNMYGLIHFKGKHIPVIDCMKDISSMFGNSVKGYIIITDIVGKGMVQQIGILLNDLSDIFQMAMNEISLQIS